MKAYSEVVDPSLLSSLSFGVDEAQAPELTEVTDTTILESLKDSFSTEIETVLNDTISPETKPSDPETWADWISPSLELGSALAVVGPATAKGAAVGGAVAGPPGAFVGGLAAGVTASATAVFASKFAGENIEDLIEGREFNPDRAVQEAMDAAQTDAIVSTVFGLALPVASKTYKAGKEFVPFKKSLDTDKIDIIVDLQNKLKDYGSSLLPSMVTKDSKVLQVLTNVAKVSQITKGTVEKYLQTYGTYMGDQAGKLLETFKVGGPRQQGEALQSLITQTDQALREIVTPLYKNIDTLGKGIVVDAGTEGRQLAKSIKQRYRASPRYDKDGDEIPQFQYPNGAVASDIKYLETLPSDLSFYEAHKRLSLIKKRLYNAGRGTDVDSDRVAILQETADMLQATMNKSADTLSPQLLKEYKYVTDMYAKGQKVVTGTWLKKALEVDDPAQIGAMLTKKGNTYGFEEIAELKKLAAEYRASLPKDSTIKGLDVDPMIGIRKGFLAETLRTSSEEGIGSFEKLRKSLEDPRYRETFDALFAGTSTAKQLDTLFEELAILERVQAGGSGFALSISSRELSGISDPKVGRLLKSFLPAFLANRAVATKNINKVINMTKAAKEASKQGKQLPKNFETTLQQLLTGQKIGLGLGAFANSPATE